jgi:ribose transport system substrate-binding protein
MAQRDRKVIGVSLLTRDIPFHRELEAGAERASQQAGLDVVVSDSHYSASNQATRIAAHAAARDVDALLVTPCDPVAVGEPIEQANRAGLPVFTLDIASASSRGKVVTHVGSDNVEGGKRAGELMVKALGGRGIVVMVMHPGIASMVDRIRGFREVVGASRGILVVGELAIFGQARAESAARLGEMLGRTAVKGIFCCNDEFAMGAVAAVEAAGHAGKVTIVGFDGTEEARQAILAGKIHADVVQQPVRMAELAVGAIRDHLAGKPVPSRVVAELTTCTAESA